MRLYGTKPKDYTACAFGCCGTPLSVRRRRGSNAERACRKAARHRAREAARTEIRHTTD